MADGDDGFTHESFKEDGIGIGQGADGKLNIFPLSELVAMAKDRDQQEEDLAAAIAALDPDDDLRKAYEATEAPEDSDDEGVL